MCAGGRGVSWFFFSSAFPAHTPSCFLRFWRHPPPSVMTEFTSGFKAVNPFLRTAQRTRVPLPCSGKGPGFLPANLFGFCLVPHLSHISCLPRGPLGPHRKLLRVLR